MSLKVVVLGISVTLALTSVLPRHDRATAQASSRAREQHMPGSRRLGDPANMAIDRQDHIYVAAGDVFKFSTQGKLLARWKQPTNANGVVVASDNTVYVTLGTGAGDDQVRKLSSTGKVLAVWAYGALSQPWGIALDARGRVIVADSSNDRLVAFSRTGKIVKTWHSVAAQPSQLKVPVGVVEDSTGDLIVAVSDRVLKCSPGGTLLGRWSHPFAFPLGVAVDRANNVYVTDGTTMQVTKLSPSGKVLATWGSPGKGPGEFAEPEGITVDSHGDIYVADYGTGRIQKFSPTGRVLAVWR